MIRPNRNPRRAYTGDGREIPSMTLANMRRLSVAPVFAVCEATGCGHQADLDVSALPDELPVPDVALRLWCSACGRKRIKAVPAWHLRGR